jgi:NADH-ubiquinone oxidoreductase chain 6
MGLAYLVVYIGAISILFLFILMLINIRLSELHSNTRNTYKFIAELLLDIFTFYIFNFL